MQHSISMEDALHIAINHHQQERFVDAEEIYHAILEIDPNHAEATYRLGLLAIDIGCIQEGLHLLERAVSLNPDNELYQKTYAESRKEKQPGEIQQITDTIILDPTPEEMSEVRKVFSSGNFQTTKSLADALVQKYPQSAIALNALSVSYRYLGNSYESMKILQNVVVRFPDDPEYHFNLGVAYQDLCYFDKAIASYKEAIRLRPDYTLAYNNLGTIYLEIDELSNAQQIFQKLLEIKPMYFKALTNLGLISKNLGHPYEAIGYYQKALQSESSSAETYNNLGNALLDTGEFDAAITCFQKTIDLGPSLEQGYGNLLFAINYHPDKSATEIFEYYRQYDLRRYAPFKPEHPSYTNNPTPDRKIKIGYVSPDFKMHPVRLFLAPLLENHDKSKFEVYAYAELFKEDIISERYKHYVDHWIMTKGFNDDALAERIKSDGIDILIDVAGHTAGNRLQVFARKPAPISVSWLGFGYTTGLSAIDYYLTDEISAPDGSESLFSEQPWRVETPSYVYRPAEEMGEVNTLPALKNGYITFGTLSRSVRINHRTIKAWAQALHRLPSSKLIIDSKNYEDEAMVEKLLQQFELQGIKKDRIQAGYHSPPWDVLREIDIGLDCFPHNSGTTLFEMLYMGIPYITLTDRPSVGRIGSAILSGIKKPGWIAHSEEEYVDKLVKLGSDLASLTEIRTTLRDEMRKSDLMDEKGFARKVEKAYAEMFQKWCMRSSNQR